MTPPSNSKTKTTSLILSGPLSKILPSLTKISKKHRRKVPIAALNYIQPCRSKHHQSKTSPIKYQQNQCTTRKIAPIATPISSPPPAMITNLSAA